MRDLLYHYVATLDYVIDGDSLRLFIDLGFRVQTTSINCRLIGIDAPERGTEDWAASGQWLRDFVGDHPLLVRSDMLDKYGRPLITLFVQRADGWQNANEAALDAGVVCRYQG